MTAERPPRPICASSGCPRRIPLARVYRHAKYCSDKCSEREAKRRKRARQRREDLLRSVADRRSAGGPAPHPEPDATDDGRVPGMFRAPTATQDQDDDGPIDVCEGCLELEERFDWFTASMKASSLQVWRYVHHVFDGLAERGLDGLPELLEAAKAELEGRLPDGAGGDEGAEGDEGESAPPTESEADSASGMASVLDLRPADGE